MSFKDSTNFKSFLKLYTDSPERVIFFVGAGLSMPLFPSWTTFLKQLVNDTSSKGKLSFDKKELLEKLDNGLSFLEIADHCAEVIGESEYREIIESSFDKDFAYDDIPNAYKELLTLPFKSIITTNYDRIPEIGGQGKFSCYTNKNISEALKAIEKGKKIVLKIHGDILNQESIILTQKDFKAIVHNNSSVQNGLRSLFSTSTICFLGFGLSDPHFNLILDFLNTINEGQNILHYAFLTSKTKFEIHSIEKKNGIRVIDYTPSTDKHPEVNEFINSLKGINIPTIVQSTIETEENLLLKISNDVKSYLGIQNYYIDYNSKEKRITINYFIRAGTEYEHQRELISIFKLFNFDTALINTIKVCCFVKTNPNTEFIKFSPLVLVCTGDYTSSNLFAKKALKEFAFWQTLKFNEPFMIGNIHSTNRKINFPYLNF